MPRYATPGELSTILKSRAGDLHRAIGRGFLQLSLPLGPDGRAADFVEVQVAADQAEEVPAEVTLELGGEPVRVRLRATHPVKRYAPLRATR
jgi:hypothetical protein